MTGMRKIKWSVNRLNCLFVYLSHLFSAGEEMNARREREIALGIVLKCVQCACV